MPPPRMAGHVLPLSFSDAPLSGEPSTAWMSPTRRHSSSASHRAAPVSFSFPSPGYNPSVHTKLIAGALAWLAGMGLALAHHGTSTHEMNTELALTGTVTEWTFRNPHSWLTLAVTPATGPVEEWSIESAPILLEVARASGETLIVRPRGSFGRPSQIKPIK